MLDPVTGLFSDLSFSSSICGVIHEGQERDVSPDEQGHIIDDDDNEDSPTDFPDVWIPRSGPSEDTNFVRVLVDTIPTKKHPETASESDVLTRKHGSTQILSGSINDMCQFSLGTRL